jgi:uroporphyrinogen decarboxylase
MTGRERIIKALNLEVPDYVPVTVHQFLAGFRRKYFKGASNVEVNRKFGLDIFAYFGDNYLDEQNSITLGLGLPILKGTGDDSNDKNWDFSRKILKEEPKWQTVEYKISTPKGVIVQIVKESTLEVGEQYWVNERPIKDSDDVERLIFRPIPKINLKRCMDLREEVGNDGIVRGGVWDIWCEASELVSPQALILKAIKDPSWVYNLMDTIYYRTEKIVDEIPSTIDLMEIIATDCTSALVSPNIYENFILPYAKKLITKLKSKGFYTTYHICGKAMALIELIAETGTTALETLAPKALHGDIILKETKEKIGDRVCLIGGMDQINVLEKGDKEKIYSTVKDLILKTGNGGGYILMPSDQFIDTPPENIQHYVDAARKYGDYGRFNES